jgi:undecaprenyl-diphosphatase
MDLLWALLLALVQGLTEWLPISSSGHLVVIQQLMGLNTTVAFDALLHLGTLVSVVAYFWKDVLAILRALFTLNTRDPHFRILLLLILGSIPAALAGFLFMGFFESLFTNILVVGIGFIATALILLLSRFHRGKKDLDWPVALLMGLFQALAIIPGVSRSGSTISSGLLWGAEREKIFRFAFLLSIPAILGATALELVKTPSVALDINSIAAAAVAAVVGYIAIKVVRRFIMSDRFHLFAIYCLVVGVAVIIYAL